MKQFRTARLLLPLTLLLAGCFWGDERETRHLVGNYYLNETGPDSGAWYLHFDDENFGLADALFNCQIVEAGFNKQCIIMRATCTNPQFYIARINRANDREIARNAIQGPYTSQELQAKLQRLSGDDVLSFDATLTNPSRW
ncbi:hypothetical protein [Hymenobacter glacialis]|nr:hypothetical protein [Hymenobacter glacialis]